VHHHYLVLSLLHSSCTESRNDLCAFSIHTCNNTVLPLLLLSQCVLSLSLSLSLSFRATRCNGNTCNCNTLQHTVTASSVPRFPFSLRASSKWHRTLGTRRRRALGCGGKNAARNSFTAVNVDAPLRRQTKHQALVFAEKKHFFSAANTTQRLFVFDSCVIFIDCITFLFLVTFSPDFRRFPFVQRLFSGHDLSVFPYKERGKIPQKNTPTGPSGSDQRIYATHSCINAFDPPSI